MLGHSILWGNKASHIFDDYEQFCDEIAYVSELQQVSYEIHMGAEGRQFISSSYAELHANLQRNQEYFKERRKIYETSDLPQRLLTYKKGSLNRTLSLVGIDQYYGTIVDFGSNDSALGKLLLKKDYSSKIDQVISVDVENRNPELFVDKLCFVPVNSNNHVDIPSDSADFVFLRYSLHHMLFDVQLEILKEIKRILKNGGKAIIIEDTYSDTSDSVFCNYFSNRFAEFSDSSKKMILSLLDASSCFIHDESMPFAFSFRSMEEWKDVFNSIGFVNNKYSYWGVTFASLFVAPMGVMICEKGE